MLRRGTHVVVTARRVARATPERAWPGRGGQTLLEHLTAGDAGVEAIEDRDPAAHPVIVRQAVATGGAHAAWKPNGVALTPTALTAALRRLQPERVALGRVPGRSPRFTRVSDARRDGQTLSHLWLIDGTARQTRSAGPRRKPNPCGAALTARVVKNSLGTCTLPAMAVRCSGER